MKTKTTRRQKTHLFGAVALAGLLIPAICFGHPAVIDSAVYPGNGHTYLLLENSNWTDGETASLTLGGNLATVNNMAENNWIFGHWGTGRNLWIGLNDAAVEGTFVWSSGEPVTYLNWRGGEPSNGGPVSEDYAYILAAGLAEIPGQWNDYQNLPSTIGQPLFHAVVEVVPEPAPILLLAFAILVWLLMQNCRRQRCRTEQSS